MAGDGGDAAGGFAGPEDAAVRAVEGIDEPGVGFAVGAAVYAAVGAVAEDRVGVGADRGGEEDAVAPDDGAGVAEAGDLRAPADVLAGAGVPLGRRGLPVGDAGGGGATEGGPGEVGVFGGWAAASVAVRAAAQVGRAIRVRRGRFTSLVPVGSILSAGCARGRGACSRLGVGTGRNAGSGRLPQAFVHTPGPSGIRSGCRGLPTVPIFSPGAGWSKPGRSGDGDVAPVVGGLPRFIGIR